MTRSYWLRIAIGIVIIFGIGGLGAWGFARGKQVVTNNYPAALSLFNDGFRLDGDRVGEVRRLQFLRSTPGVVDSAILTVNVDSASRGELDHCILWAESHNGTLGGSTRFACADADDSSDHQLVRFGHVVVEPGDRTLPLYVSAGAAEEAHRHAYRGAGGDAGNVDINHFRNGFSLTVNNHELVRIGGDSNGGSVVIRDGAGHPLVEINDDSNGGSVKITDENGKTRVNVHSGNDRKGSTHVDVKADTN